ncbi:MAG: nucleoside hydrolase [Acidobacteria bacterium]|nr:nucleoside hydrolase [Acidobacteriota bacterium]MBV9624372.1 nucleoside hydrolase [Acidobacteriota bacterium]
MRNKKLTFVILFLLLADSSVFAQQRRKVVIDQDCSGPGGSNMQTLLTLIQSPQVEVLGITVVSGNQWRDEEISRTLRLLELIGRTDIPVVPGAVFPLVHRRKEAQLWQERYGKVAFAGAWDDRWWHEPEMIPKLIEGEPHTKAADEDAAHFLIRMVHKYPHAVTIYEGGPMTDLALANAIDPHFAELAEGLVFMGGSLNPQTDDPEFLSAPRHEFNFWFDPEAARSVLEAPWKKIVCTPVDISVKTRITDAMVLEIKKSNSATAQYVAKYFMKDQGGYYMWDELAAAAWIDPTLITKKEERYMNVDVDHGAEYGNTLTWTDKDNPMVGARLVEIQQDLNLGRFNKMFVDLMKAPTPQAP